MGATRLLRTVAAVTVAGGFVVAVGGPAAAATTTVSSDVAAGSDGTKIGTATFTRTAGAGSSDTLAVNLSVPAGITESMICLSPEPFTERLPAGKCPYKQGGTGASASYSISLGSAYAGKPVYAQVHVVSKGETAYAGWQPGKPFYGNVSVAAALADTTVPVLAAGGLVTAALAALGLGGLLLRQRRNASPAAA